MNEHNNGERLRELERKWMKGTITDEEAREYAAWYNAGQDEPLYIPENIAGGSAEHGQKILHRIDAAREAMEKGSRGKLVRIVNWRRLSAAAVIMILFAAGAAYFFQDRQRIMAGPIVKRSDPGRNKAILTLSDGSRISLDSSLEGSIGRQANAVMDNRNGTIEYKTSGGPAPGNPAAAITYNSISTPKGGKYEVILSDDSKVWLNTSSTLHYPVSFSGRDREVELAGEAYFEIKEDPARPFGVKVNGVRVQVLGTRFNINAYQGEPAITTTLLEGRVKVVVAGNSRLLRPDQRAEIAALDNGTYGAIILSDVNAADAIAWKNGLFLFRGTTIVPLMRELARWYDIDVTSIDSKINEHFYATLSRNSSPEEIFKTLEMTGSVTFRLEGNKVSALGH